FDPHGKPDSSYGLNGVGENDIQPAFQPKGFFLSSDFGEITSGMTSGDQGHSIFVRISDTTARPDPIFNHNGVISVDIDSGKYPNYLKFVQPIGKLDAVGNIKRFIAMGGSIQQGVGHFMIARFIGHPPAGVSEINSNSGISLNLYPNPASSSLRVDIPGYEIDAIRIVDPLGREILVRKDKTDNSLDISKLPNGFYYCIAKSGRDQIVRKFIVSH
ncbi:MAG: T9SS type A sorting domain-containing protein, partial [Candidatus Kapaibacterium sp.]